MAVILTNPTTPHVNLVTDIAEYVYNSSVTSSDDLTSFSTGTSGGTVPNIPAFTYTNVTKRIAFTKNIAASDFVRVEVKITNGSWVQIDPLFYNYDDGCYYGVACNSVAGNTYALDIVFGGGGKSVGVPWSTLNSSLLKWRVRKINNGNFAEGNSQVIASSNFVFYENVKEITANYMIPIGYNASSTGPISIQSGKIVTIPSGSRWVIL